MADQTRTEQFWVAACLHIIGCRKKECPECGHIAKIIYEEKKREDSNG